VGRRISRLRQEKKVAPPLLRAQYFLARTLVFNRVKKVFGGRVRVVFCAGAPVAAPVLEFFHAADLLTLEGYGATETTAALTFNVEGAYKFGTVGKPFPGQEIKLAQDGEILVRGSLVFIGYFRDAEKTKAALSPEGWYATGDIGELDEEGFLKITDRKKDIIVTSGGKNIAPQNIENALKQSPYISQAMVCGDKRNFLTALVTLDADALRPWAAAHHLTADDWPALCRHDAVRSLLQAEIDAVNQRLARFETIKRFRIVPDEFAVEGGELTPTLKVKRRVVNKRYCDLIDGMYDD